MTLASRFICSTKVDLTTPLSRKEDVIQRVPDVEPSPSALQNSRSSDGIEWNRKLFKSNAGAQRNVMADCSSFRGSLANPNSSLWTAYSNQPFTTIKEVLANSSAPNRYRLKARASAIKPISKAGDMIVKWCRACQRS